MRFDNGRESQNVEDRRGSGGGRGVRVGGKGIGLGTIVLALVAMYFGVDPSIVLNQASVGSEPSAHVSPAERPAAENEQARFISMVLADTEQTWGEIFRAGGERYVEPKLVLFTGATRTACGVGQAAMGPFYCPGDQKVYIDLSFYDELRTRFHAPGDFAQAYVIAHEIGHHVQNLLGISDKVQAARQRASEAEGNQLSVRLELQADCLAGVWANHADRARNVLESGDLEEALNAASAIGDDQLQKQAQGYAVPDSFTHGTSAQRVRWFRQGMESGSLKSCDTFSARQL
ncbi:KPN_02809 family neutral zinc metallopeptidase [Cognatazoarcus halotolerans]|uniref:KPN_02809 family neutral zinc metallopeptidase n=1 Tax=Cognatazoarcus halotolerans TaxID=2686016 RepID=UPI00135B47EE|nr:neutral zinc metallopeptidase [Cognatazoarcus halotolerans]MBX3680617.1 neutral zinc metallopeptidase [Rhodocyclaceae bacterium]MCB1900232.1 neutral zinc metallopeptidase [Rhodocyclaceae bacterium]MCP5307967.1 neutral zinc metallopeptidase [Zoogloeaceae bacterium]